MVYLICGGDKVASAQTRANAKWQAKKGLISKSYKLKRETVDMFAEACENVELSQSMVLSKYMEYYIKRHHPDYE
jgi:hypothetical protein